MSIQLFPLEKPSPDFETFENVAIKGIKEPQKVLFVELLVDPEVIEFISRDIMGVRIPSFQDIIKKKMKKLNAEAGERTTLLDCPEEKRFWKQYINFYYLMGYDCVPEIGVPLMHIEITSSVHSQRREVADTAALSRGKRMWAKGEKGSITSIEDFENFPWDVLKLEVEDYYDFLRKNLPEGMRLVVQANLYETIMERLMGYESLFYLLYDEPELVKAVFDKLGNIIYEYYKRVIPLEHVGAIFHPDDLGFKTNTMLSPDVLRKLYFPWLKKYASLAHENGKTLWYHCCGYKNEIMESLIKDVGIDALHSFEDVCCPVTEYKRRYGNRIGILGGVDMDKLCRLDEKRLRKYVRGTLDMCMRGGRYALGAGNSIANYVPIRNYLIMLDEGLRWRSSNC